MRQLGKQFFVIISGQHKQEVSLEASNPLVLCLPDCHFSVNRNFAVIVSGILPSLKSLKTQNLFSEVEKLP